jgi:hypothetical protein
MASTEKSGKITGFSMSEAELASKIEQYKEMVKSGQVEMPFWTDFREFLGVRQDVLDDLMDRAYFSEDAKESAYHSRALMIKSMGETCENYLTTHSGWSGKNAVKSIMLLKQGLGYTQKYQDERSASKGSGVSKAKIVIASHDPRAKDMGK